MPAFLPPSPLSLSRKQSYFPYSLHSVTPRLKQRYISSIPRASLTPDVLIVGGGPAALCTAYELSTRGLSVHLLTAPSRPSAGLAAAGMLAPQVELLEPRLRTLCQRSLSLYPSLVDRLRKQVPHVDVAFLSGRDFLVPYLADEQLPPDAICGEQMRFLEPALTDSVTGVTRFIGEASVDNRALMKALREACQQVGVTIEDKKVQRVEIVADSVNGVVVEGNLKRSAGHYVVACGAWMRQLLPWIPIRPVKGEMISIKPVHGENVNRLRHVLHGKECYVVPRGDGYFVGATMVEDTFSTHVSVSGMNNLLQAVCKYIKVEDYAVTEVWAGVRPATPDLLPVLGRCDISNLSVAGGAYRNGILLGPVMGKIVADGICGEGEELDNAFAVDRFWRGKGAFVLRENSENEAIPTAELAYQKLEEREGETVAKKDARVMMWKIHDDGSQEAVEPSEEAIKQGIAQRGIAQSEAGGSGGFGNRQTEENELKAGTMNADQVMTGKMNMNGSQGTTEPLQRPVDEGNVQQGVAANTNTQGGGTRTYSTDAYEDVLQHRDTWEETMRVALEKNRAFGRKKSSLEKEGVPPLSLSEEDVQLFDQAMQQGLKDMEEAEATFREDHPSVVATRADKEKAESMTPGAGAEAMEDRQNVYY